MLNNLNEFKIGDLKMALEPMTMSDENFSQVVQMAIGWGMKDESSLTLL